MKGQLGDGAPGSWSWWSYAVLEEALLTMPELVERLKLEHLYVRAGFPRRSPPS